MITLLASKPARYVTVAQCTMGAEWKREIGGYAGRLDAPRTLVLLGEPDVEVGVEVAAERGRPGKRPPQG